MKIIHTEGRPFACHECNQVSNYLIELGYGDDYCAQCLKSAYDLAMDAARTYPDVRCRR